MWCSISFQRRGLALFALLLTLARLAAAQAPSFDMAVVCGEQQVANSSARSNSMATDAQGNTILAGYFYGSVHFGATTLTSLSNSADVFIAKRTAAGVWLWAVSGGGISDDICTDVAVDALGQVYITGYFGAGSRTAYVPATFGSITLTSTGGNDALVAKLDGTTGQYLWATSAGSGTANGSGEAGKALAIDALGGLLLTGSFSDFRLLAGQLTLYQVGTGTNLFVARLDATTGIWTWATNPGPASATDLALDSQGNGYISGSFGSTLTLGNTTLTNNRGGFVASFSPAGSWRWATALVGSRGAGTNADSGNTYAGGIAVDEQDKVYLCGFFNGATALFSPTILTNASLSYQGPQIGTVQLSDAYVAHLSSSTGAWQWAVRAGGTDDESFACITAQRGRISAGGSFGRGTMLDTGTPNPAGSPFGATSLVSAGKFDAVVASLTDAGQWQWAVRAGGPDQDQLTNLALDAGGRVQLLGYYYGPTTQFGPLSLTSSIYFHILSRLSGGALAAVLSSTTSLFALYPNPTRTRVILAGLPADQPVQVLDALGRLVFTARTPAQGPLELTLPPGLAAGLYMVRAAGQARQLAVE